MINFSAWLSIDSCAMSELHWRWGMRVDRTLGYLCASWNARVGKMVLGSSWFFNVGSAEQKKEAPNAPFAKHRSATVWAIAVFPVPASPFSQKMGARVESSVHRSISSRRATRVPLRQPRRFLCSCPAPAARLIHFSTVRSAIYKQSADVNRNQKVSDRGPMGAHRFNH